MFWVVSSSVCTRMFACHQLVLAIHWNFQRLVDLFVVKNALTKCRPCVQVCLCARVYAGL